MNNFPSTYLENIPGLAIFKFVPVDDVASVGDDVDWVIDDITFEAGKDWLDGYSLPETLKIEEPPEETEHGRIYNVRLSGKLPQDSASLSAYLQELTQYRFLVAVKDMNDAWKLYGSLNLPLLFDFKLNKSPEENNYDFSFSGIHVIDAPYFLDPALFS